MDNALSPEELNIMTELANLTSGSVASVLTMLVDPDIQVSPPQIATYADLESFVLQVVNEPSILATLQFQNGLESPVAYILNNAAAGILADVMLGSPSDKPGKTLTDIQSSAVGEAISQMVGATANNMSQFLSQTVEITAPELAEFNADTLTRAIPELAQDGLLLAKFHISGSQVLPEWDLLQVLPMSRAKAQVSTVRNTKPQTAPAEVLVGAGVSMGASESAFDTNPESMGFDMSGSVNADDMFTRRSSDPITVQPVEFPAFDHHPAVSGGTNKNLELVMDVCLNLTVELGRTELPIKDVLELTRGSVVELNRVAGESVDLFANGKMIAKGEVVVIEDNFGLRITSIVSPADRLRGL